MRLHRLITMICIVSLMPLRVFAEAPVVDDSENFALLEEQQVTPSSSPVAHDDTNTTFDEKEPALARENVTEEVSNNNVALLNKIQGLQQDIQELRGQIEVQAHDLKQLQEQQLTFYKDLDARIRNTGPQKPIEANKDMTLNTTPDAASTPPTTTPSSPSTTEAPQITPAVQPVITTDRTNPADEQISYLAAYDKVKTKQYDEAEKLMLEFVAKYPNGGYTANAQYWLGELYMVKKDYSAAITHFEIVLNQFPTSNKCSASLLKLGYALAFQGKTREAKERLREVIKKYPDTSTAELAATKLATLGD